MELQLLRLAEVLAKVRLGKTTLYSLVKEGAFPAPIRIGKRATAWRAQDIHDWVMSREVAR